MKKKPKIGSGQRFASLSSKVAKSYVKSWKTTKKATEIWNKVAWKIMWESIEKRSENL